MGKRGPTAQRHFDLEVKTLPTIIEELGHTGRRIDVLKVDVEGSEYAFLEQIFDTQGCPSYIDQLTIEWHHHSTDSRYGAGSAPSINVLATLLHACGLDMFWI